MKPFNSIKLVLLFLLFSKLSFAQKTEIINSGELINKSIELSDSSKFKEAIALLNKVNRNDTNYVNVLLKKAILCRTDSQYNEGIKLCKQALSIKANHELAPDIYNIYGNLLLDMENYDGALKIFEEAIAKFPAYSVLYFNKGIVYLRTERYELAETWFQKTLLIDPYMYSAHYQLGLAAVLQGKIVPAYISAFSYLLFSPKGKYAEKAIDMLQQISVTTDEIVKLKNNRKSLPNANYQDVEDVIVSKIALDKSYKLLTAIDDPISRQIQAVIEKLVYTNEDPDFYTQYYVPLFKRAYADKKFDLLIHHLFSNVNIPAIATYVDKNKKQIDNFTGDAGIYFDLIRATRELMVNRRDTVSKRYYFEGGLPLGKGTLDKTGKLLIGGWEGCYAGGNTKSKGMYNMAGQRNGSWTWFYPNGALKAKENFVNGKLEGLQEYYYFNGNKSSVEQYVNGELHGLTTIYYYGGSKKNILNYKNGKLDGANKNYFISGVLASEKNFTAGELNGTAKEYFKNGKLKSLGQYVNGKTEGGYKQYYANGKVSSEGNFLKDLAEGDWKYYDEDGKINKSLQFHAGMENGLHQEYYVNGQLSTTCRVEKDKINGELIEYYPNGKILSNRTYVDGAITQATYLDATGRKLSAFVKNGEANQLVSYNHFGLKRASVNYNKMGLLEGADTLFFNNGNIDQISYYKDGVMDGKLTTYYKNGKIKSETTMANDKTDGYYTSYYMNGNKESEGWIIDDVTQGEWTFYHENGKLNSVQYYLDGELDGYKDEYFPSGQKSVAYKYHLGWLEETEHYDLQGKVIANDVFIKGQGKFRLLFPNGKLMAETNLKDGEFDGPFKSYYFDGSIERTYYYKAGMVDSTYVSYQHGGLKTLEGKYAFGDRVGLWKFYDDDGKLSRTSMFNDDVLNGSYVLYFPNGNKEFESIIKNGDFEGHGKTYDPKGPMVCQVLYQNDFAVSYAFNDGSGKLKEEIALDPNKGVLKSYFPNGKVSRECTYLGGQKHGDDLIYYESGVLMTTDHLVYSTAEGPSKSYYENGKLKSDFNYLNDNVHGLCKTYYENGALKRETNFEHGVLEGAVKMYNEAGKLLTTKIYEHGVLKSVKDE